VPPDDHRDLPGQGRDADRRRAYNVDPLRVRLARGATEALGIWADQGWPIAIVTNQAGVALGLFTVDELDAVASHLETIIREAGGTWGGFYACPHLPEGSTSTPSHATAGNRRLV
jgi:histidinol phosphatase-like enzyme